MAIGVSFYRRDDDGDPVPRDNRALEAAGAGRPNGRLHHTGFGADGQLQVFDVWESQATFDEFGKAVRPIPQKVAIDPGQPVVERADNVFA